LSQARSSQWPRPSYKDGRRVRLISRNAIDHTARFRELAAAIAKLKPERIVLDGEVAVYDEKLVSRFHLLGDLDTGIVCTPPVYIAFGPRSRCSWSEPRHWGAARHHSWTCQADAA
jgi:hypothetical protein